MQNTGDVSARLRASADLELQGTYDSPGLIGEMEISPGGEFTFLGKRYSVTQGVVYFNDPRSFEPYVDLEAETRVRVPGETYRARVRFIDTDWVVPAGHRIGLALMSSNAWWAVPDQERATNTILSPSVRCWPWVLLLKPV